jgi:hypothetical protein
MSTTPTPIVSIVPTWVTAYTTFIKAHEKLLIIIALAAFAFYGFTKAETAWDNHLQRTDDKKVAVDNTINQQLASQLETLKANFAATEKANETQITLLLSQLKARQVQDDALPLPQLSSRWAELLGQPTAQIVPTKDIPAGTDITNTVTVSAGAAHATVDALEKLPVLTNQLTLTTADLTVCKQVSAKQDQVIAGLNTTVTDVTKARNQAEADLQKQKSRNKFFAILSFVGGMVVGHRL